MVKAVALLNPTSPNSVTNCDRMPAQSLANGKREEKPAQAIAAGQLIQSTGSCRGR